MNSNHKRPTADKKTICFFGIHDLNYERVRVLKEGFIANGFEVFDCSVDPRVHLGISKYLALVREWRNLRRHDFDFVLVCFPGQSVLWLARILFGKNIIFDAFVSLYDSNVSDRRLYGVNSLRGWRDWIYDWYSCAFSSVMILDTKEHCLFFNKTFGVPLRKCFRVFVSADPSIFNPRLVPSPRRKEDSNSPIIVEFHGIFIPVHGLEYVIDAADFLKDLNVEFQIIGRGQNYVRTKELIESQGISNIRFFDSCPIEGIRAHIARADICLGLFGNNEKATRAIPQKVFYALAMGKPIVTMDSQAARELLVDGENALLCAPASGRAIADAVRRLVDDPLLREKLGRNARLLYERSLQPKDLVAALIRDLYNANIKQ